MAPLQKGSVVGGLLKVPELIFSVYFDGAATKGKRRAVGGLLKVPELIFSLY